MVSTTAGPTPAIRDRTDPRAVATEGVSALLEWDTHTDKSPADATARAAPWLTTELHAAMTSAQRTDSTWLDLETHHGYTTVEIDPADEYGQPDDTPTTAYVQLTATITSHGRDGWTARLEPRLLRVVLSSDRTTDGTWRIAGFAA